MNRTADLVSAERMIALLSAQIEKMQSELGEAEGERRDMLIKLIRIGSKRLSYLRTLH